MLYKLDLTQQKMKDLGFKYDHQINNYVYEFPVYKFRNKSMITCKIWIDEDTKLICHNVYDANKRLYSSYYNREYGTSNVVSTIDKNIQNEIVYLGAEEIE